MDSRIHLMLEESGGKTGSDKSLRDLCSSPITDRAPILEIFLLFIKEVIFSGYECGLGWMLLYIPELTIEAVQVTEKGHIQLSEANHHLVNHNAVKQKAFLGNIFLKK